MNNTGHKQRLVEKILKKKKTQIEKNLLEFKDIKEQKAKIIEFLEKRKKQDEETYLQQTLKRYEQCSQVLEDELTEYKEALKKSLYYFSIGKSTLSAYELFEEYAYCKEIIGQDMESIDKEAQCLFEYFIKTEDIDFCIKFLETRVGGIHLEHDKWKKRREKYVNYIKDFTKFEYTSNSDIIIDYGMYRDDILTFMELCGRLDARSSDKKIFYSDKTKNAIISASIGCYGSLVSYLYSDGEFGHYERDRKLLMYWHDKAFIEEKKLLKSIEKTT